MPDRERDRQLDQRDAGLLGQHGELLHRFRFALVDLLRMPVPVGQLAVLPDASAASCPLR
ncbi:hypothetical protein GCM10020216_101670 [Nonomuraea helvata]